MITGKEALEIYFDSMNKSASYAPKSFDQFLNYLNNHPNRAFRNVEDTITSISETMNKDSWFSDADDRIEEAMITLASKSGDKIPDANAFTAAISGKFTTLGLSDYKKIAGVTISQISEQAVTAGKNVMFLNKYGKPIAIGSVVVALYFLSLRLPKLNAKNIGKIRKSWNKAGPNNKLGFMEKAKNMFKAGSKNG